MRGTSSANKRGSSYDRRRRRRWIIEKYARPGGKTIPCYWCRKLLRTSTIKRPLGTFEVDRLVCGHDGGRYVRENVVPACARCNATRCGNQHKKCCGSAPQRSFGW